MAIQNLAITSRDIETASKRIKGYAYRTPCYRSFSLKDAWLKLECFQPVRSFKIRGASNKILSISEKERRKGLITASSGNHGLAVAYVANRLGIPSTIVLPENVIPEKLEMIRSLGSRTIFAGKQQDERAARASEIQKEEGQIFIQPFNDPEIIAGQGTCGLEILADVPDLDSVLVPIGGGGLISGIALAIKLSSKHSCKIIGVQPEGSPSMYESWRNGKLSSIEESKTVADGLSVRKPGDITFSVVKEYVDDIVLVSDKEIIRSASELIKKEHVLVEPSGAASFAALSKIEKRGRSVAVISGGNVSSEMLKRLIIAS